LSGVTFGYETLEGKKPMEVITSGSWLTAKVWEVALGGGYMP
jgi:hypothetical protein